MTTGSLEHNLRVLAKEGFRLNLWPTKGGRFQANVSEAAGNAWTVHTDDDPLIAIREATRQRLAASPHRETRFDVEPDQVELEEAIAEAKARDEEEDLIG